MVDSHAADKGLTWFVGVDGSEQSDDAFNTVLNLYRNGSPV